LYVCGRDQHISYSKNIPSTIVHSRWDFGNEIVITSIMNGTEETFLYCCEALKMPHTQWTKIWSFEILQYISYGEAV